MVAVADATSAVTDDRLELLEYANKWPIYLEGVAAYIASAEEPTALIVQRTGDMLKHRYDWSVVRRVLQCDGKFYTIMKNRS